jgi:FKBP-type peptidyl-prolyl cis-trans isomerase FklB
MQCSLIFLFFATSIKVKIMKYVVFACACIINAGVMAQSKKEVLAENQKLKTEIARLTSEVEELKKPKTVKIESEHQRASYALGVLMASNIVSQGGDSLDAEVISEAFKDYYGKKELKIAEQECMPVAQQYMQMASSRKMEVVKSANEKFLEQNKTNEGVKVTASGLQYKVISSSGKGKSPAATDNVTVHYTGKLIDGILFDSSVERGLPSD